MTRPQAWFLHLAAIAVGGTGLVYGWMRYLAESDDPFAIVNHPWQPQFQHLHVLAAPLLVFGCGLIWIDHVWARLRARARRRSGWLLVGTLVPMIASGYLVQVTPDEAWRAAWIWTHGLTSLAWILGYLVHQFLARPRNRRA